MCGSIASKECGALLNEGVLKECSVSMRAGGAVIPPGQLAIYTSLPAHSGCMLAVGPIGPSSRSRQTICSVIEADCCKGFKREYSLHQHSLMLQSSCILIAYLPMRSVNGDQILHINHVNSWIAFDHSCMQTDSQRHVAGYSCKQLASFPKRTKTV